MTAFETSPPDKLRRERYAYRGGGKGIEIMYNSSL
jgi:hypothetical protein